MPRSGRLRLDDERYLTPEERERRAREKERQAIERGLTPDWFLGQGDFCLPPGGLSVAVIGGGFSGLFTAWYLKRCGVRTVVYEARPEIGGRVRTDRAFVPGKTIEAGAELIGENHPLWRILARRYGLGLVPLSDESSYPPSQKVRVRYGEHDLTPSEKQELEEALPRVWDQIAADALTVPEVEPWYARKAGEFDGMSVALKLDKLLGRRSSFLRTWFEFTLGNDNCKPVEEQSYLGLLSSVSAARMGSDRKGMYGYWLSTETHRCDHGNDLLGEKLAQDLHPSVRVATVVKRIEIPPVPAYPPVVVESEQSDASGKVVARRRDGFHYAVLTAPSTVWKAISISPEFPLAGRSLLHGPAIKFLTRYPTPFWREAGLAPLAKWTRLGSVWEGTDRQPETPGYDLSVFSGGQFVFPQSEYAPKLTQIYPTRTRHPGSERFVDWEAEAHIKAGYAVPGVGQVTRIIPALWRPHERRLLFAGEQASPGFFGYMEGALQAGGRAAREILRASIVRCPRPIVAEPAPAGGGQSEPYHGGGGESGGGGSSDSW